jgi:hypothetical protein
LVDGVVPSVWIAAIAALVLVFGGGLFFGRGGPVNAQGRRQFRLRPLRRLVGLLLLGLAGAVALLAASLYQFYRLTDDVPIARLTLHQQGDRQYTAVAEVPDGSTRQFYLRGDEWQIDARVVRWKLPALLAGVPPLYRLERLSGRYADPAMEQTAPRTVYPFGESRVPDLATLKRRFPNWLPFVDVQFGSAAYMPMFDDAHYRILLDPRGALFVRPDDAATAEGLKQRGW